MSEPCRAAVLGQPISHSLSPVLHRAAYEALGLKWTYDAIEVGKAGLAGFIDSCDSSWAGLSLTMPLKETVLDLLDETSAMAVQTRSANTVLFLDGGARRGENTDVEGIRWALASNGVGGDGLDGMSVAILGAGATSRSAVAALAEMGATMINVAARRREPIVEMAQIADQMSSAVTAVSWADARELLHCDLVLSTVPAGVADHLSEAVPGAPGTLMDIVYSPWPTALARSWAANGGPVIGGLDMLVGQAAEQVRLMTGHRPPVDVMMAAGRDAL